MLDRGETIMPARTYGSIGLAKKKRGIAVPDHVKRLNRQAQWKRRGINLTLPEYDEKYQAQNGCCAICGRHVEVLDVDHDHTSRRVRGLLCRYCNWQVIRKIPQRRFKAVAEYLNTYSM
jgi:DNA-directed RNA polymerase subunit RPC12/RpoP